MTLLLLLRSDPSHDHTSWLQSPGELAVSEACGEALTVNAVQIYNQEGAQ